VPYRRTLAKNRIGLGRSAIHYAGPFRVKTVDTTGAGDIFHAGFITLLQGWPLQRSSISPAPRPRSTAPPSAPRWHQSMRHGEELRPPVLGILSAYKLGCFVAENGQSTGGIDCPMACRRRLDATAAPRRCSERGAAQAEIGLPLQGPACKTLD